MKNKTGDRIGNHRLEFALPIARIAPRVLQASCLSPSIIPSTEQKEKGACLYSAPDCSSDQTWTSNRNMAFAI
jgi:hypothetical protein